MTPERPGFRSDIEGLRGVAILLVVGFHAGASFLSGGFVGVDVFFVLSGFLITGILAREVLETGDVDLAEFYARRARRILPAFIVVLLATVAAALWLYAPVDAPAIASDGRHVALHYGNVLFAQQAVNYHATSGNPFLHTWSLAVEEQFYVIWPLLFACIGRWSADDPSAARRRLAVAVGLAGAVSFIGSIVVTRAAQPWAFFAMPTRIWEFALGGGAAFALRRTRLPGVKTGLALQVTGLVAILGAACAYSTSLPYPGAAALLPAAGAVAVIGGGALAPESAASRLLGTRMLQRLGRVSYAWYLWHWPLVGLGVAIDWQLGVAGKLAWSAVALGLAVLTNRFIEAPARRVEKGFVGGSAQRTNVFALGTSIGAALIAWGALVVATQRTAAPAQRPFAAARVDNMRHDCWGSMLEDADAPCVFGDSSSATRVVLLGDSHAEHWLPAMDRIGRARHWKVYAMVKPACPVADLPEMRNARLKRDYVECTAWRRAKLQQILRLRPSLVVLSSYDHYIAAAGKVSEWSVTAERWRDGLRRTYALLSAAGIKTIALRDVPDVGFDVPACLSRRASDAPFQVRGCEYDLMASLRPSAIAAQTEAARGLDNVAIVSMNDRLCTRSPCAVVKRGAIVYRDDDHLTATFSRAEAAVLGERLAAAANRLDRHR
jgi:peptidoglycan/LPS O-acetylase OafA/YrhL